jgi:hypothetical protein
MPDHPFADCVKAASDLIAQGHVVFQKFTCAWCGARQTMERPNRFYDYGSCEECGPDKVTNIMKHGMNYQLWMASDPVQRDAMLKRQGFEVPAILELARTPPEMLEGKEVR